MNEIDNVKRNAVFLFNLLFFFSKKGIGKGMVSRRCEKMKD